MINIIILTKLTIMSELRSGVSKMSVFVKLQSCNNCSAFFVRIFVRNVPFCVVRPSTRFDDANAAIFAAQTTQKVFGLMGAIRQRMPKQSHQICNSLLSGMTGNLEFGRVESVRWMPAYGQCKGKISAVHFSHASESLPIQS